MAWVGLVWRSGGDVECLPLLSESLRLLLDVLVVAGLIGELTCDETEEAGALGGRMRFDTIRVM